MPQVRGHYRRGYWFRSHWVRGHYRSRPGTNALIIVGIAVGAIFLLWFLERIL